MDKDTAILDYAKYVENDNKLRYEILKSKGLDVKENQNLDYYTSKMQEFPDKDEDIYVPPKYFEDFEKDWENDPLRADNGGEYKYTIFMLLKAYYSTSFINLNSFNGLIPCVIKTSDEQVFEISTKQDITITWDSTKDLINENNDKYRWVKIYTNNGETSQSYGFPMYPTSSVSGYYPQIIMLISDANTVRTSSQTSTHTVSIVNSDLQYLIIGKNTEKNDVTTSFYGLGNLECIKVKKNSEFLFLSNSRPTSPIQLYSLQYFISEDLSGMIDLRVFPYSSLKILDISKCNTILSSSNANGYVGSKNIIYPSEYTTSESKHYLYIPNQAVFKCPIITNENIQLIFTRGPSNTPTVREIIFFENLNFSSITFECILTQKSLLDFANKVKDNINELSKTIKFNNNQTVPDYVLTNLQNKNWTITS